LLLKVELSAQPGTSGRESLLQTNALFDTLRLALKPGTVGSDLIANLGEGDHRIKKWLMELKIFLMGTSEIYRHTFTP
jgi:hypothetical protein